MKAAGLASGVEDQIDVTIDYKGKPRRILMECKDYDISGDKVGLGVVRDFVGVITDVKPDEAVIITCNDFTAEAPSRRQGPGCQARRS